MANTSYLTPLGGYSDAGAIMLRNMAANAELLTEFLRFQRRVFKHPASVALEFFTQKPDATFIATAAQWEKAGFTVTPGSDAIKFFDEHGKTIEMYDFSQCEEEVPPMIWAVTNQNLAAVKKGMSIPADSRLLDGLVVKSVDSELIVNAMRMLNVPPQNHAAFQKFMVSSVAQIIAGRLSVNGGNFRLETDNTAFKSLKTTEQRMIYLAITGKAARVSGKDTGLTDQQIKAADINENGELSVDDVQNILIYYVNNTVAGKKITWEQLLGKQPQAQSRPGFLKRRGGDPA